MTSLFERFTLWNSVEVLTCFDKSLESESSLRPPSHAAEFGQELLEGPEQQHPAHKHMDAQRIWRASIKLSGGQGAPQNSICSPLGAYSVTRHATANLPKDLLKEIPANLMAIPLKDCNFDTCTQKNGGSSVVGCGTNSLFGLVGANKNVAATYWNLFAVSTCLNPLVYLRLIGTLWPDVCLLQHSSQSHPPAGLAISPHVLSCCWY